MIDLRTATRSERLLRRALHANAMFSAVSGVVLVLVAIPLAGPTGVAAWLLATVCVGLLPFAHVVRIDASAEPIDTRRAWAIVAAEAGWVIAAVVIIVLPTSTTAAGKLMLGAVSLAVAAFGIAQAIDLRVRQSH